jgi:hypothetical protein
MKRTRLPFAAINPATVVERVVLPTPPFSFPKVTIFVAIKKHPQIE